MKVDEFYLEVIDRTTLQRRTRHAEHRNANVQTPEDFVLLTGLRSLGIIVMRLKRLKLFTDTEVFWGLNP